VCAPLAAGGGGASLPAGANDTGGAAPAATLGARQAGRAGAAPCSDAVSCFFIDSLPYALSVLGVILLVALVLACCVKRACCPRADCSGALRACLCGGCRRGAQPAPRSPKPAHARAASRARRRLAGAAQDGGRAGGLRVPRARGAARLRGPPPPPPPPRSPPPPPPQSPPPQRAIVVAQQHDAAAAPRRVELGGRARERVDARLTAAGAWRRNPLRGPRGGSASGGNGDGDGETSETSGSRSGRSATSARIVARPRRARRA